MNYVSLAKVFEEHFVREDESPEAQMDGADKWVEYFNRQLGLEYDSYGRPSLDPKARFKADDFTLKSLAESLCGWEWANSLGRSQGGAGSRSASSIARSIMESDGSAVAITPGNLPNVSSYLGSIVGLLDAKMISGYKKPEFIGDQICETVVTKTRQVKMIGLSRMGDMAHRRNPGDEHKFAQVGERFSLSTATENDGLAGAVTFEAVFYDETREIMDSVYQVGDELGFRKELDTLRVMAGVSNPYNYKNSDYNTWGTSGNWINDHSNPFVDWTSVNAALSLGSRFTDQEQGLRVVVEFDTIVCSPKRAPYVEALMAAREVEHRTQSAAFVSHAPNPMSRYKVLKSVNLDDLLTRTAANGGLALVQANADEYWWLLKTGTNGFMYRTENWPLTVEPATPDSYTMKNRRILLAVFADQSHAIDIREPRHGIRNKN